MKYKEVLTYLMEQLPMFQRIGAAAYRADLGNITQLLKIIGNPERELKCIHIAGTNGKGSTTHIIASILQEQGYKVGVFVSPHYKDYRERIKINGKYISKKFVTRYITGHIDEFKEVNASFFEMTTAMAFEYFKQKKVDYAIIETGMGGRLDSTNVVTPLLSVITNISFDHQQFLGNTLAKIAKEKAGIIKRGIPVVIGETQRETKPVFTATAKTNRAKIYFADKAITGKTPKTDLAGSYQEKNISTALMAVKALQQRGVKISGTAIKQGLKHVVKNTGLMGRWMQVSKKPLTVLDSAHNEGGLREVLKNLDKLEYKHLHIVFGTVADKDISKTLGLLPKTASYYYCKANIPRALDATELKKQAAKAKLKGKAYNSVAEAYKAARATASKKDMILVCGSIFVVAEVL